MADVRGGRVQSAGHDEHVKEVARILWPEPSVVSVGRWPSRAVAADVGEWLILPSLRQAWWLLPAGRRDSAQALLRHDHGQRNRMALKLLASLQSSGVLRLLPLARILVHVRERDSTIETELRRILGQRVEVCVRLGRRRLNRALVLQPLGEDGRTCAFVKMATTPAAGEALGHEAANLTRAASLVKGTRLVCPEILSAGTWREHPLLVMSPLLPEGKAGGTNSMPLDHMLALARAGRPGAERLDQADATLRQDRLIDKLPQGADANLLRAAHDFLVKSYGDVVLETGFWHGDWVPWNMARTGEKVLLWDWEHFSEGVPVGWDLAHYLAQQLRIDSGTSQEVEDEWLAAVSGLLSGSLGLGSRAGFAVMYSYLIEVNLRYLADRALGAETTLRKGWGLPLLTRLAAGSAS